MGISVEQWRAAICIGSHNSDMSCMLPYSLNLLLSFGSLKQLIPITRCYIATISLQFVTDAVDPTFGPHIMKGEWRS